MKEDYVRKRNKYINFRVTPEEYDLINRCVSLSGIKKQDFLAANMLNKTIVVNGNPKVFKGLKTQMQLILDELKRINDSSEISEELQYLIKFIAELLEKLNVKDDER